MDADSPIGSPTWSEWNDTIQHRANAEAANAASHDNLAQWQAHVEKLSRAVETMRQADHYAESERWKGRLHELQAQLQEMTRMHTPGAKRRLEAGIATHKGTIENLTAEVGTRWTFYKELAAEQAVTRAAIDIAKAQLGKLDPTSPLLDPTYRRTIAEQAYACEWNILNEIEGRTFGAAGILTALVARRDELRSEAAGTTPRPGAAP